MALLNWRGTVTERFWNKVVILETGCWQWTAARSVDGYAHFWPERNQLVLGYRWAYEYYIGPVPNGLQLDHLCRNTSCVNPFHLEPVTHKENILRGDNPCAINAKKTHCAHGHPYSGDNLYIQPNGKGGRKCRICIRRYNIEYNLKRK